MAARLAIKEETKRVRNGSDVLGRPIGHVVKPQDRLPIVTQWSGYDDYVNAPPDYGTFHKQYISYTRWFVARFGIPPNDLEDVVADIMTRFLERDSLGVFSREWTTRSKTGRSNFRSYYSRFLADYSPGKNRNVRKHNSRNLAICDAPVDDEGTTTWLDVSASSGTFEESSVDCMDFEGLVSHLRSRVNPDLAGTVDVIVELALGAPVVRVTELAKTLGVSKIEAKTQLEEVREVLARLLTVSRIGLGRT